MRPSIFRCLCIGQNAEKGKGGELMAVQNPEKGEGGDSMASSAYK